MAGLEDTTALVKGPERKARAPGRGLLNWRQAGVLSDRYLETMLADWKATGLLLIQAPLLAGMAVMVWGNVERANLSLYFVMTLSCLWLGCIDACREVVKEKALFLRERMVNLEVGAYLFSKVRVLVLINGVQVVSYALILDQYLDVRVPLWAAIPNLLITTLCGTCLGLLISSAVARSDYAVGLVPLVILPQILFSEFAIDKKHFAGWSEVLFRVMPSRWGYESLIAFADTEIDYVEAVGKMAPPLGLGILFLVLAYPLLRMKKY